MPRKEDIGCTFDAHTLLFSDLDYTDGIPKVPASRGLGFRADDPVSSLETMIRFSTALENNPRPMRSLLLPLFCVISSSFDLEEYLQILCRLLQLATPNSLNLVCVLTDKPHSAVARKRVSTALDIIRRVLCPVLLGLDSLVHIGVHVDFSPEIPIAFTDFIDDIFSSTPGCHSLSLGLQTSGSRAVQKSVAKALRKRTLANVNDARFHRITRIQYQIDAEETPILNRLAVELSRSLRVSDFTLRCDSDFFRSPEALPAYLSVLLVDRFITSRLCNALSSPHSSIRGLILDSLDGLPPTSAAELGNAIGSSQLEEITVIPSVEPEVLDAIARGVGRSQILYVSVRCAKGSDVRRSVVKMLACSSLRELQVFPKTVRHLSKKVIDRVLQHTSLEYCRIGESLPLNEAYDRMCDGNFTKSVRLLTLLLLQWVGSFTELAAVDINLLRFVRMLMVMPTSC